MKFEILMFQSNKSVLRCREQPKVKTTSVAYRQVGKDLKLCRFVDV